MISLPLRYWSRLGAAAMLATVMGPLAFAQQPPQGQTGRSQAAPAASAKAAAGPAREGAPAGDAVLRQRVEQL